MATLSTSRVADSVQTRDLPGVNTVHAEYSLAAALALNDIIEMVKVPPKARIVDVLLSCTDLDTGGSPAISLLVGDADDTDRFIQTSTIGRTGGFARMDNHAGNGYRYTAETKIIVTVSAGPATGATSGTVRLTVTYDLNV